MGSACNEMKSATPETIGGGYTQQRLANVDLLRFICSVFVIIEHFCETEAFNGFGYAEMSVSTLSLPFLRIIYSLARVAVPVFILLSGYCSINSKKAHIGKVVELVVMVICFSAVRYCASVFLGSGKFSWHSLMGLLLPRNYYVYLYLTLYILTPYINSLVEKLSKKQYKTLICVLLFMFVVWSTIINTFQSVADIELREVYATGLSTTDMGFTICIFVTCYLVGGYIRKYNIRFNNMLICSGIIILALITAFAKIYFPVFSKAFLYYDSVFVITQAILTVILFVNFSLKPNRVLSYLGKNTLGVYLIHGTFLSIFAKRLFNIETMIDRGFVWTVISLLLVVICTFVCSLICSMIYSTVMNPLMKKFNNSRIGKIRFLPESE